MEHGRENFFGAERKRNKRKEPSAFQ